MELTDLTLLQAFVSVAKLKSFSKASESLNLSLPNVSKKVQQLETALGVKLLHRTTRSVSLTVDGENFLRGAEVLLADLAHLRESFAQNQELSGEIRVACLPSIALRWLPEVLLSFQRLHPKVSFNIEATDRIVDLVSERIDVAIRVQAPRDLQLIFRKLALNELVLVASPQYLKASGRPKSLRDLSRHSVLMLSSYGSCRFASSDLRLSDLRVKQTFTSDSGVMLTELALAGAGIAVRSQWDVSKLVKEKKLIRVLPGEKLEPFGELFLVSAPKTALNRRTSAFIEHASSQLSKILVQAHH